MVMSYNYHHSLVISNGDLNTEPKHYKLFNHIYFLPLLVVAEIHNSVVLMVIHGSAFLAPGYCP